MSKIVKILLISLGGLVIGVGGFVFYLFSTNKPTQGPTITPYATPRKALLVIDLQTDFIGENSRMKDGYPDRETVITRVNQLQQAFRADSLDVIHIRQVFAGFKGKAIAKVFLNGSAIEGTPGVKMDPRVESLYTADFTKPIGDAFANPELSDYLISHQVDELILVGMDVEYCVHDTAIGARNRGYKVTLVTDASLLQNSDKWDALKDKYRQIGCKLTTTEEMMTSIH